jgi:two-component system sensor histidine kinase YesM
MEEKAIITYKEIPLTGWKLMGIIPVNSINKWNDVRTLLIFLIFLGIISVAFTLAVRLSNKVTNPLRNLIKAMKKVEEGNLNVSIIEEGYEEVSELSLSFNKMITEIKLLLKNTNEEHRKLRKAELKALQAQINPHFLYNTLDSILWLNRTGMRDEVQTLVESLTTFFRIGISKGKDIITLREELEHVESYLKIQSIRYANKFDYAINVDKKLLDYQIPKLVLQPLVENAIYHGVKLITGKGYISIDIMDMGSAWQISIHDTGKGMEEETCLLMNNYLQGEKTTELSIYGVGNVNDRLQIIYGGEAKLHYTSVFESGTTVTVTLPKVGNLIEE